MIGTTYRTPKGNTFAIIGEHGDKWLVVVAPNREEFIDKDAFAALLQAGHYQQLEREE